MVNVHGASVKLRFNTYREYVDITTYNHTERIRFNEIIDISTSPIEHEEQYSTVVNIFIQIITTTRIVERKIF